MAKINKVLSDSNTYGATKRWVLANGASPLTTKGDVYTFSTTNARLGVGTNGYVLTADSSEATGLKWAASTSANYFLDGLTFGTDSKITGSMDGTSNVTGNAMTTFTPATTFVAEATFDTGIVVGATATAAGYIKINPDTDDTGDFPTTLKVGVNTEAQTYTLPLAYPASSGYALVSTDAGVMSWAVNQDGNYYVTGGTYSAGAIAFSGTTSFPAFSVTGIPTGTTTATNTQTFTNKTWNGVAIADAYVASATNWNDAYNNYVASAAYSAGTLTFTQRDGGTFTATGFEPGDVTGGGADTYISHWTSATNVTGTAGFTYDDSTDAVTLSSATASKPTLTLTNTNDDATSPFLIFNKNTANPAVGDNLGYIRFDGKDSAGGSPTYADIFAQSTNVTNTTEEGAIRFRTSTGGSMAELMIL